MKRFYDTKWHRDVIAKRELAAERARLDKLKPISEKLVDTWLKRAVEEAGGITFKMHPITDAGIPDRIVHCRNMTFYVETKATGEPCRPIQIEMHKRLHAKGMTVYVLDTKITSFYDLFTSAYTTYESKHYHKNPHKIDDHDTDSGLG